MKTEIKFTSGGLEDKQDDRRNQRYYREVSGRINFYPEEDDPFGPETIAKEVSPSDLKQVIQENVHLLFKGLEVPFEDEEGPSYRDGLDQYSRNDSRLFRYADVMPMGPMGDKFDSPLQFEDDEYHVDVGIRWCVPAEKPSEVLEGEHCFEAANLDRLEGLLEETMYESVRQNLRQSRAADAADQANRLIDHLQSGVDNLDNFRGDDEEKLEGRLGEAESISDEIAELKSRISDLKEEKTRLIEEEVLDRIENGRDGFREAGWDEPAIDAAQEYLEENGLSRPSSNHMMRPQTNHVKAEDVIDEIDVES